MSSSFVRPITLSTTLRAIAAACVLTAAATACAAQHAAPPLVAAAVANDDLFVTTAFRALLDEVIENQNEHTQVIGVGPGVRARHILSVGLDLGLPTGALATLAAKSSAQNAYMVSCLLANHGFVYLEAPFIVQLLPAMLAAARGAVFNGIPPYDLWEHPPAVGKIPPHGSDAGSYLLGEVFGARVADIGRDALTFEIVGRPEELDALNLRLGIELLADGRVYVGTTRYRGLVAFRPAIVNWRTTEADVDSIVDVVRELGARIGDKAAV